MGSRPDQTTTSSMEKMFPVQDITHKPRRMQGDSIRVSGRAFTDSTEEAAEFNDSAIPVRVTIESAITYFEANAQGALKPLFDNTAKWLREYRPFKNKTTKVTAEPIPEKEG